MLTDREQDISKLIKKNPLISQQEIADILNITRSSVAVHISNMIKKGVILGKGYVIQHNPYIVVIGGQNMDIFGRPDEKLIYNDSNPGKVRYSQGGVGRNIAHNLSLLDEDVKFITVFGDDNNASILSDGCRENNIDIQNSLTVVGGHSTTYLFITDEDGEMELAVADMELYDYLTPEFLETKLDYINRASALVVDTNLTKKALDYIFDNVKTPIFVDAVSTTKAKKLKGNLSKIHTIKVNKLEAELLTGIKSESDNSFKEMADVFLEKGTKRVVISLGEKGIFCAKKDDFFTLPVYKTNVVNTTGAGDSQMAALVWAFRQGFSFKKSAHAGLAASSICLESSDTVNKDMSQKRILERIKNNIK